MGNAAVPRRAVFQDHPTRPAGSCVPPEPEKQRLPLLALGRAYGRPEAIPCGCRVFRRARPSEGGSDGDASRATAQCLRLSRSARTSASPAGHRARPRCCPPGSAPVSEQTRLRYAGIVGPVCTAVSRALHLRCSPVRWTSKMTFVLTASRFGALLHSMPPTQTSSSHRPNSVPRFERNISPARALPGQARLASFAEGVVLIDVKFVGAGSGQPEILHHTAFSSRRCQSRMLAKIQRVFCFSSLSSGSAGISAVILWISALILSSQSVIFSFGATSPVAGRTRAVGNQFGPQRFEPIAQGRGGAAIIAVVRTHLARNSGGEQNWSVSTAWNAATPEA